MSDAPERKIRSLRMEDVIDLQRLCIRLNRTVSVSPGPIDLRLLSTLEQSEFEQAPVYDSSSDLYWGLVETSYLRSLYESGHSLRSDDPIIRNEDSEFHVGSCVTIFGLLKKMTSRRAVVVIQDSDNTEYGQAQTIWGLFTMSDLNRHAVRTAIYHLLADVEAGLAKWLEVTVANPWDWLRKLDEEQQVRVIGFWELSKLQGVDVGPYAALTLSQLLTIIHRLEGAAAQFGFESRTQFEKAKGPLPKLRNLVMHPVRPLVLTHADVASVNDSVLMLEDLRQKVEVLLGSEPARPGGAVGKQ